MLFLALQTLKLGGHSCALRGSLERANRVAESRIEKLRVELLE